MAAAHARPGGLPRARSSGVRPAARLKADIHQRVRQIEEEAAALVVRRAAPPGARTAAAARAAAAHAAVPAPAQARSKCCETRYGEVSALLKAVLVREQRALSATEQLYLRTSDTVREQVCMAEHAHTQGAELAPPPTATLQAAVLASKQPAAMRMLLETISCEVDRVNVHIRALQTRRLQMSLSLSAEEPALLRQLGRALRAPGLMPAELEEQAFAAVMRRLRDIQAANKKMFAATIRHAARETAKDRRRAQLLRAMQRVDGGGSAGGGGGGLDGGSAGGAARAPLSDAQALAARALALRARDARPPPGDAEELAAAVAAYEALRPVRAAELELLSRAADEEAALALEFLDKLAAQMGQAERHLSALLQELRDQTATAQELLAAELAARGGEQQDGAAAAPGCALRSEAAAQRRRRAAAGVEQRAAAAPAPAVAPAVTRPRSQACTAVILQERAGGMPVAAEAAAAGDPAAPPGRLAVWLDCDPGHDDAMAIMLAGHSPALELLGVSTVASNQSVDKTTRNALDVLHWVGLGHVGVAMGQARPLLRPILLCPEIHGDSGLDGPAGGPLLPHCGRAPLPGKGVTLMAEAIARSAAAAPRGAPRVQLICTGALTNAALLLLLHPELVELIDVTIMGGALGLGNTGAVAEFNIQVDPEAAKVVFESGVRLTMVPLEVTHTALVSGAVLQRIAAPPTPFRALVGQLLTFFEGTYRDVFGFDAGPPLHDPCAVAAVIAPELFEFETMRVDIETTSPLSAGQTVCDVRHVSKAPRNCRVARRMDVAAFWELMLAAVDAADAVAPMNAGAAAS
ncbi:iunH [Scenedesmus sp. PABB004]|nr:iunH [Scenedesmus sp. PABB004]